MEKRNVPVSFFVYLVTAILVASCASSTPQLPEDSAEGEPQQAVVVSAEAGPFEVAVDWASALSSQEGVASAPESVRQVVGGWKIARVARVWAAGDDFRAVVVQKNTARETPAVLLHIARGDNGKWQVTGAEPTTSTHLWSEL